MGGLGVGMEEMAVYHTRAWECLGGERHRGGRAEVAGVFIYNICSAHFLGVWIFLVCYCYWI